MRILLHHNPQQSGACLESLVDYAYEIERSALVRKFTRLDTFVGWLQLQPVKLDLGEAPQRSGCNPTQRSRIWPSDGFNCWEATAHFLGVAIALNISEIVHIFDVTKEGVRHVFPALQDPLQARPEIPIQLQKFGMFAPGRAQGTAWNKVADVAHGVGASILGLFGAEALVPLVDLAWTAAPTEYGLSKNAPPPQPTDRPTPETPQKWSTPESSTAGLSSEELAVVKFLAQRGWTPEQIQQLSIGPPQHPALAPQKAAPVVDGGLKKWADFIKKSGSPVQQQNAENPFSGFLA